MSNNLPPARAPRTSATVRLLKFIIPAILVFGLIIGPLIGVLARGTVQTGTVSIDYGMFFSSIH